MRHSFFLHAIGILIGLAILVFVGAGIVMALWNGIITAVCGFAAVGYWQAMGLLALGLTLSGGGFVFLIGLAHIVFPHHHSSRHELFRKWHHMTDEQRRVFLASRGFNLEKKN